jgi:hypothetical protein
VLRTTSVAAKLCSKFNAVLLILHIALGGRRVATTGPGEAARGAKEKINHTELAIQIIRPDSRYASLGLEQMIGIRGRGGVSSQRLR